MSEMHRTHSGRLTDENRREHWHIDKKVPVAIILSMFAQTVVFVWWLSALNSRVATAELWITRNEKLEGRLTRIETILERIDRNLGGNR